MSKPFEVNVSSAYGAPMGRRSESLAEVTGPVHLQRVPAVDGDYDPGGAYWGSVAGARNGPAPLYCAWGETTDEQVAHYVRALDRESAKAALQVAFPSLKFFR